VSPVCWFTWLPLPSICELWLLVPNCVLFWSPRWWMLYRVLLSLGLESEYVVCAKAIWLNDTAIAPESTTGKNFRTIASYGFE
jgi:hypothetical protein